MHADIHLEQAQQASEELLNAMQRLMVQLTAALPPDMAELDEMLTSGATTLFLARQAHEIIGMAALTIFRVPSGLKAWIEDVVVDESQRGKGIGEALTVACIDHARALGVSSIHLTSNPARVAANRLYQKLGFQRHETNLYHLKLK